MILVVGGAICAGSVDIGMFLAGRVIAGIGSGILAGELLTCSRRSEALLISSTIVVVPMYQGEISTAETRGAMMCVTGKYRGLILMMSDETMC